MFDVVIAGHASETDFFRKPKFDTLWFSHHQRIWCIQLITRIRYLVCLWKQKKVVGLAKTLRIMILVPLKHGMVDCGRLQSIPIYPPSHGKRLKQCVNI